MSSIFLTGATGYIGGQVLHELANAKTEHSVTALVRDSHKAKTVSTAFPKVRIVIGDLDDTHLVEEEASKASIVLHLASTSHLASVQAIHRGLKKKAEASPVYWLQISGASALAAGELASDSYVAGSPSSQVFDDISGVSDIKSIIQKHASARVVDNYILDVAAENSHIRTALVFGPIIYGKGQGPINQRSYQIPELARVTLEKGHGVRLGQGLSRWGNIHVGDIGRIFTSLVDAATGEQYNSDLWGENGLYLAGVGEITFGDISAKIAQAAKDKGFNQNSHVQELDRNAFEDILPHGTALFGSNARGAPRRAQELLHWSPREEDLELEIPRAVTEEHERSK